VSAELFLVPLYLLNTLSQCNVKTDGLVDLQLGLFADLDSVLVEHLLELLEFVDKVANVVYNDLFILEAASEGDVFLNGAGVGFEFVVETTNRCG
jgi:hypothetical protein